MTMHLPEQHRPLRPAARAPAGGASSATGPGACLLTVASATRAATPARYLDLVLLSNFCPARDAPPQTPMNSASPHAYEQNIE